MVCVLNFRNARISSPKPTYFDALSCFTRNIFSTLTAHARIWSLEKECDHAEIANKQVKPMLIGNCS